MGLSREDETCAGLAWESRYEGKRSSVGLREGKEYQTRTLSAEKELRRVRVKNEFLMTALIEKEVQAKNLEKKLEEKADRNGCAAGDKVS